MKNILGISALSASGKDTFAKVLIDDNWMQFAFADPIKRMLMDIYDWPYEVLWGDSQLRNIPDKRYPIPDKPGEFLSPRIALHRYGDAGRELYANTWIDRVIKDAIRVIEDDRLIYIPWKGVLDISFVSFGAVDRSNINGILFSDIRYKNEFDAVQNIGGKLIRIMRPGHSTPKWNHSSETAQLEIPDSSFDILFANDYKLPEDNKIFERNIKKVVKKLFGE